MEPRRVYDKLKGDFGTAVEYLGNGRYRVEWDDPTPWQHKAAADIPGKFFEWAIPQQFDGSLTPAQAAELDSGGMDHIR
jgi:hypothetical protein